jgi:hypothetical protein
MSLKIRSSLPNRQTSSLFLVAFPEARKVDSCEAKVIDDLPSLEPRASSVIWDRSGSRKESHLCKLCKYARMFGFVFSYSGGRFRWPKLPTPLQPSGIDDHIVDSSWTNMSDISINWPCLCDYMFICLILVTIITYAHKLFYPYGLPYGFPYIPISIL